MMFKDAVLTVANKAKAALPANTSRIEKAVMLCLNGHIEVVDGKYRVASQVDGKTVYRLVNGSCGCVDFTSGKAPQGFCKHRLAANIYRRAVEMIAAQKEEKQVARIARAMTAIRGPWKYVRTARTTMIAPRTRSVTSRIVRRS